MSKTIHHQKSKSSVATPISPLLVSIPEAARILATTVWQIRTLLWSDRLPHIKLGKRHLIPVAALQSFVQQETGMGATVEPRVGLRIVAQKAVANG